jgi:hypothetical protein
MRVRGCVRGAQSTKAMRRRRAADERTRKFTGVDENGGTAPPKQVPVACPARCVRETTASGDADRAVETSRSETLSLGCLVRLASSNALGASTHARDLALGRRRGSRSSRKRNETRFRNFPLTKMRIHVPPFPCAAPNHTASPRVRTGYRPPDGNAGLIPQILTA